MEPSDAYAAVRTEKWSLDKLGNWVGEHDQYSVSPMIDPCAWPTIGPSDGDHHPWHGNHPPGATQALTAVITPGHSVELGEGTSSHSFLLKEVHYIEPGIASNASAADTLASLQPNALGQVQRLGSDNKGMSADAIVTDVCGNTVFDGSYYFQYDAWNRLCQVNQQGTLTAYRFGTDGYAFALPSGGVWPSACHAPVIGPLVKHYTYDGVGRLARTSSPVLALEGWSFAGMEYEEGVVPSFTRSERFLYDGVRRIQEIVTDPILADGEGNRVATMSFEIGQRIGGGGGNQMGEPPGISIFLRAQYVWGPGDNGVDELLCQIDPYAEESHAADGGGGGGPQGKPWFILTDAQGDVVSIVNGGGALGLNNQPSAASVAGQWTYSPYGEVLTYDALAAGGVHPAVVFGHKTLAVDRLDAPTLTWENESEPGAGDGSLFETQRLVPDGRLIAYARNRTLDTSRGRWLQNDPNASGLLVLSTIGYHGQSSSPGDLALSGQSRFADGLSLYGYTVSNPIVKSDPIGLFFTLPDTMITIAETALEKGQDLKKAGGLMFARAMLAKQMGTLYGGAYAVADGLLTEISGVGLGTAGGGMGLYQAVERLGGQNSGELFAFGETTFRANLTRLTGFSGQFMDAFYQAHHIIPQKFREQFMRFGINIDNPIFGQWIRPAEHSAMHAKGAYNAAFDKLLAQMKSRGLENKPEEALEFALKFIRDEIVPNYKQYGLMPPF